MASKNVLTLHSFWSYFIGCLNEYLNLFSFKDVFFMNHKMKALKSNANLIAV